MEVAGQGLHRNVGYGLTGEVVAVTADTLRLRNLVRDIVEVSRRSVRPGPLDAPAALGA